MTLETTTQDTDDLPKHVLTFRVLDRNGDTKHEWDPSKPEEVEAAREVFTLYKAQGFTAARMANNVAGEIIREFDPTAGEILFIPVMSGG